TNQQRMQCAVINTAACRRQVDATEQTAPDVVQVAQPGKATRVLDQSRLLEPLLVPYSGHRHQLITIKCQPVIGYLDITEIITAIENSSQVIAREELALRALFIDKRLHGRKVVMTGAANGPA